MSIDSIPWARLRDPFFKKLCFQSPLSILVSTDTKWVDCQPTSAANKFRHCYGQCTSAAKYFFTLYNLHLRQTNFILYNSNSTNFTFYKLQLRQTIFTLYLRKQIMGKIPVTKNDFKIVFVVDPISSIGLTFAGFRLFVKCYF